MQRTLFLLDQGPLFSLPTAQSLNIEISNKDEEAHSKMLNVQKSLWSCCIEAVLEYRRIVFDIFNRTNHLSYLSFGIHSKTINDTSKEELTLATFLTKLAKFSKREPKVAKRPQPKLVESIPQIFGIMTKHLSEANEHDRRLVVITSIASGNELLNFFQRFSAEVKENRSAVSGMQVKCVNVCLLNVFLTPEVKPPVVNMEGLSVDQSLEPKPVVHFRPQSSQCPKVEFELYNVRSSDDLLARMYMLLQKHYSLASTTVCNIPMKEGEQNTGAASSKTYDVELMHSNEALTNLRLAGLADESIFTEKYPQTPTYKTVRLNWGSTLSKYNANDSNPIITAVACTPVTLNSRESICLTTFIQSGKTIFLELHNEEGVKQITHTLKAHGKVIYIHSLACCLATHERQDTSKEKGGSCTHSYRTEDFVEFCKTAALVPRKQRASSADEALNSLLSDLRRRTTFWPLTNTESLIMANIGRFDPLLSIIRQATIAEQDISTCRKLCVQFLNARHSKDMSGWVQDSKWKAMSMDCQVTKALQELEMYARNYRHLSKMHRVLYNAIVHCIKQIGDVIGINTAPFSQIELDDDVEMSPERVDNGNLAAESCETLTAVGQHESLEGQTLLSYWERVIYNPRWASWREFEARAKATGDTVKLYANLTTKVDDDVRRGDKKQ